MHISYTFSAFEHQKGMQKNHKCVIKSVGRYILSLDLIERNGFIHKRGRTASLLKMKDLKVGFRRVGK